MRISTLTLNHSLFSHNHLLFSHSLTHSSHIHSVFKEEKEAKTIKIKKESHAVTSVLRGAVIEA